MQGSTEEMNLRNCTQNWGTAGFIHSEDWPCHFHIGYRQTHVGVCPTPASALQCKKSSLPHMQPVPKHFHAVLHRSKIPPEHLSSTTGETRNGGRKHTWSSCLQAEMAAIHFSGCRMILWAHIHEQLGAQEKVQVCLMFTLGIAQNAFQHAPGACSFPLVETSLKLNIGTAEQLVQHDWKVLLQLVLHEHVHSSLNDMTICAKTRFVWSIRRKHAGANPRSATSADLTADKDVRQAYASRTQEGAKSICILPLYHTRYWHNPHGHLFCSLVHPFPAVWHIQLQCFQDKPRGSTFKSVSLAARLTVLLWHS